MNADKININLLNYFCFDIGVYLRLNSVFDF